METLASTRSFPAAFTGSRRHRAVGVTLHSLGERHRLEVTGPLPPGWVGALAHGLASLGFGIRKARGRRDARGNWDAEIAMTAPAGCPAVASVDFRGLLTRRGGARRQGPVVLDSWTLAGPTPDGTLALSVVGRDSSGFLASLLECVGLFSLFPQEFVVETEAGVVRDRLILRGLGGRRISAEGHTALGRVLDDLVAAAPSPDRSVARALAEPAALLD